MIIAKLTLGTPPDLVVSQAQADAGNMSVSTPQVIESSRQVLAKRENDKRSDIARDDDARKKRAGVKKNDS